MATADTEPWVYVEDHGYMPLSAFVRHRFLAEQAQTEEQDLDTLDAEAVADDFNALAYTLVSELGRAFMFALAAVFTCVALVGGAVWAVHKQNAEIAQLKSEVTTLTNRVSFWVPETMRGDTQ